MFYCLLWKQKQLYNIIKATTAFTSTSTSIHPHTHLHKKLFCHPPDPPNASAAGPAATAAGPSPGEGANASRVLQTKTAGTQTQNITPGPTHRQTHGCKEQKMSKQMEWTGNKNERSASGKSREYKKYAARVPQ